MRINAILAIFGILVAIFVFSGCVSLKYFDPQWYAYNNLIKNSLEVYDKGLYDYSIDRHIPDRKIKSIEGLQGFWRKDEDIINIDSRLAYRKVSFFANVNNVSILYQISHIYIYTEIGLFLIGDEGRGFDWETKRTRSNSSSSADIHDRGTIIYIEEKNNDK